MKLGSRFLLWVLPLVPLAPLDAQTFIQGGDLIGPPRQGLHINGASLSAGYASTSTDSLNFSSFGAKDVYYTWASTSFGYARGRGNTIFTLNYRPSYAGTFYGGDLHAFNQILDLQLTRKINGAWTYFISASGTDETVQDFLFATTPIRRLVGGPANIDVFAGALSSGASSLLNTQALLFGDRWLSFGGITGAYYRPNTRLTMLISGRFNQSQPRDHLKSNAPPTLPRTRTEEGGLSVSYNLTPRSYITADATGGAVQSYVGDYKLMYFTGGFGRRLGLKWFAYGSGGAGSYFSTSAPAVAVPGSSTGSSGATYVATGVFGYRGRENTVAGIYGRHVGDTYGLGAGSTSSYQGAWNWQRRDRRWELHGSVEEQSVHGGYLGNLSLWQLQGGLTHSLSRQTAVSLEYSYLTSRVPPGAVLTSPTISAVRLTFYWIPAAELEVRPTAGPGDPDDRLRDQ